jgi:hypothetical protein
VTSVLIVQCSLQCGVELFPLQPEGPDVVVKNRESGVMFKIGVEWDVEEGE